MATIDHNEVRRQSTGRIADPGESAARSADRPAQQSASIEEELLEIRLNDQPLGVTTRTPDHDDELAVGILVAKGIVCDADDVLRVATDRRDAHHIVNVTLDPDIHFDCTRISRHVLTATSSGLRDSNNLDAPQAAMPIRGARFSMSASMLRLLPRRMSAAQRIFRRTDEPCAAAVFDHHGRMTLVREDICRHNAVDKVLGYGLFNDLLPFDRHVLVTAGRASYEVVQKALAGGFPIVLACGEPSSLAERFAREAGQTLVIHGPGECLRVHTHPHRITQADATPRAMQ